MKSQKECVYESVINFFKENGIKFSEGQNAKDLIDTEGRKLIHNQILASFKSGAVSLKIEMNDEELTKYIPALLSNHLRKDTRLNGGEKYEAAEPGNYEICEVCGEPGCPGYWIDPAGGEHTCDDDEEDPAKQYE
jgi:hypothetical protein